MDPQQDPSKCSVIIEFTVDCTGADDSMVDRTRQYYDARMSKGQNPKRLTWEPVGCGKYVHKTQLDFSSKTLARLLGLMFFRYKSMKGGGNEWVYSCKKIIKIPDEIREDRWREPVDR